MGLLIILSAPGCDRSASIGTLTGDGGSDGAFDDPGSGSKTLLVTALIDAAAEESEGATSAAQLVSELTVQISKAGSPISGAHVTFTTGGRSIALTEGDPGRYGAEQPAYTRRYQLDIEAGSDRLTGARLSGPAAHSFTAPRAGASYPPNQPLLVAWAPSGAPLATIETRELPRTTIPDSGRYTVAGRYLQGKEGESSDERVRVRRSRRTALAGAAPGSSFEIRVRSQVSFQLQAR